MPLKTIIDITAPLGTATAPFPGDTPSVDPADRSDLPAHERFRVHNIRILETLRLQNVDCGDYELIALPLRLQGSDASPVRAVLRTLC